MLGKSYCLYLIMIITADIYIIFFCFSVIHFANSVKRYLTLKMALLRCSYFPGGLTRAQVLKRCSVEHCCFMKEFQVFCKKKIINATSKYAQWLFKQKSYYYIFQIDGNFVMQRISTNVNCSAVCLAIANMGENSIKIYLRQ